MTDRDGEGRAAAESAPAEERQVFKIGEGEAAIEIGLDEALAGYSRAEDLRLKEAALAQERRRTRELCLSGAEESAAELRRDIARELQRDWASLAAREPEVFRLQAEALLARRETLQRLETGLEGARAERRAALREALAEIRPEFAAGEAFQRLGEEIPALLERHGLGGEAAIGALDHRDYAVLADALAFEAEAEARRAIEGKRRAQPAPQPIRPAARSGEEAVSARLKAMRERARQGGLRERADYILARLAQD